MSSRSSGFCRKEIAAKRHKKRKNHKGISCDFASVPRRASQFMRLASASLPFLCFLCLFAAILSGSELGLAGAHPYRMVLILSS